MALATFKCVMNASVVLVLSYEHNICVTNNIVTCKGDL
jgi:hypothetical protein